VAGGLELLGYVAGQLCCQLVMWVCCGGMWLLCLAFVFQMVGVVLFCIAGGVVVGGLHPSGEWLCMGAGLCCQGGLRG
jgi:hypothetical protein